jgi:hypothetical protein
MMRLKEVVGVKQFESRQQLLLEVLGVTLLVPRVQCLCLSLDCWRSLGLLC